MAGSKELLVSDATQYALPLGEEFQPTTAEIKRMFEEVESHLGAVAFIGVHENQGILF